MTIALIGKCAVSAIVLWVVGSGILWSNKFESERVECLFALIRNICLHAVEKCCLKAMQDRNRNRDRAR